MWRLIYRSFVWNILMYLDLQTSELSHALVFESPYFSRHRRLYRQGDATAYQNSILFCVRNLYPRACLAPSQSRPHCSTSNEHKP